MKLFVKRENWDGGIWMKLPASEEQAEQVQKKLAGYHPSRMFPFRGDVEAPVAGLTHLLIGDLWRDFLNFPYFTGFSAH